jgi:hypothetical protein
LIFPIETSSWGFPWPGATALGDQRSQAAPVAHVPRASSGDGDVGPGTLMILTRPGKHTKNDRKSPCLMGKLTISMAIFNSYVELPEGNDI